MPSKRKSLILTFAISAFFVIIDQLLKGFALKNPNLHIYLIKPYLGWELFKNTGVAFGLSIPQPLVLFLTPIILFILGALIIRDESESPLFSTALFFILGGAISNYIDRVFFGSTIDYVRILTGVINLADIQIVLGFILLLFTKSTKIKKRV